MRAVSFGGRVPSLAGILGVAVLLVSGCGGSEADVASDSAAATAARSFSCTQTTSSRGTYRQAVSGTLDASNLPHDVRVTRVQTGVVEVTSANPTATPSYDGGYWKQTYGIDAWFLGTLATGYPTKYYYFLLPPAPGATFTALLKTDFGLNGSQGNWQHWMACTAQ